MPPKRSKAVAALPLPGVSPKRPRTTGTSSFAALSRSQGSERLNRALYQLNVDLEAGSNSADWLLDSQEVRSLAEICAKCVAKHVSQLTKQKRKWDLLPSHDKNRVLVHVRRLYSEQLTAQFLEEYFIYADLTKILFSDLAAVTNHTLSKIKSTLAGDLTVLDISGCSKIADANVYKILKRYCKTLQRLNLSRCVHIGNGAFKDDLAHQFTSLQYLNLSYTQVTAVVVDDFLRCCSELYTLKHTGLKLSDQVLKKMLSTRSPLNLKNIRFRHSNLTLAGLHTILQTCPELERLDLSHNAIKSLATVPLPSSPQGYKLRKLNLSYADSAVTGTSNGSIHVTQRYLEHLFEFMPNLESLYLQGANGLASWPKPRLKGADQLKVLILSKSDAREFVRHAMQLCPRLQYLDLRACTSLKQNGALAKLFQDPKDPDALASVKCLELEVLNLSNTGISDYDVHIIGLLKGLKVLHLNSTSITGRFAV